MLSVALGGGSANMIEDIMVSSREMEELLFGCEVFWVGCGTWCMEQCLLACGTTRALVWMCLPDLSLKAPFSECVPLCLCVQDNVWPSANFKFHFFIAWTDQHFDQLLSGVSPNLINIVEVLFAQDLEKERRLQLTALFHSL